MILSLDQLIKDFSLKINGVIHVGAHVGQEFASYEGNDIKNQMWFEPCRDAYLKLTTNLPTRKNIKTFNIALGNETGKRDMFVEMVNQGMSNSLLEPGTHLQTYPKIKFSKKEEIFIEKLDNIDFLCSDYNMLYMDVQGFELEVLKGSIRTLSTIKIIYTEINTEEVYKGCVQVDQLDKFLGWLGFTRVHTQMACKSWGDALYLKK